MQTGETEVTVKLPCFEGYEYTGELRPLKLGECGYSPRFGFIHTHDGKTNLDIWVLVASQKWVVPTIADLLDGEPKWCRYRNKETEVWRDGYLCAIAIGGGTVHPFFVAQCGWFKQCEIESTADHTTDAETDQ